MRLLAEMLAVADDAQLEGRTSMVDHGSIVQAAGTLRRIANRLADISMGRRARRCRLRYARGSNRGWSSLRPVPSFNAARAAPARDSRNEAIPALDEFSRRLEEQSFARISARSSNAARYSPSCSPCAGSRF